KHLGILCGLLAVPGTSPAPSSVDYTLRVDSAASSEIAVEMHIHGAPAVFRIAMATHAEYDDEYFRYVSDVRGESPRGPVTVAREDSTLWRVSAPPGDVVIRYRVHFPASPPGQQASWKAHLTPTGGLVG